MRKLKSYSSLLATLILLFNTSLHAEIKSETIKYDIAGQLFEGTLSYDDSIKGKRPGVLVVHEWWGHNAYAKKRAEMLAKLGYTAFALDMYGAGKVASHPDDAKKYMEAALADMKVAETRFNAALKLLQLQPTVYASKIAAIGYCFGGTTAIELARAGAAVVGVVSFHGGLDSPAPADGKNIKGKILALHGADDPFVSAADLAAFEQEMRGSGVDWQLVKYGGAVHSFTNPAAGNDNSKGNAYNATADRRSWKAMEDFFAEVLTRS